MNSLLLDLPAPSPPHSAVLGKCQDVCKPLGSFVFCGLSHHLGDHHYPRLHGLFRSGWPGAFGLSLVYGEPLVQRLAFIMPREVLSWQSCHFLGIARERFTRPLLSTLADTFLFNFHLSDSFPYMVLILWEIKSRKELHVGSFCFLVCPTEYQIHWLLPSSMGGRKQENCN